MNRADNEGGPVRISFSVSIFQNFSFQFPVSSFQKILTQPTNDLWFIRFQISIFLFPLCFSVVVYFDVIFTCRIVLNRHLRHT